MEGVTAQKSAGDYQVRVFRLTRPGDLGGGLQEKPPVNRKPCARCKGMHQKARNNYVYAYVLCSCSLYVRSDSVHPCLKGRSCVSTVERGDLWLVLRDSQPDFSGQQNFIKPR